MREIERQKNSERKRNRGEETEVAVTSNVQKSVLNQ